MKEPMHRTEDGILITDDGLVTFNETRRQLGISKSELEAMWATRNLAVVRRKGEHRPYVRLSVLRQLKKMNHR